MIVTDCNECSVNELEIINRTTNIVFEINDGEIVNFKVENKEETK